MMASMQAHSPWGTMPNTQERFRDYNAWQIRTSDGETAISFLADRNKYIFNGLAPVDVCPLYLSAMDHVKYTCSTLFPGNIGDVPVYISSNRYVIVKVAVCPKTYFRVCALGHVAKCRVDDEF